MSDTQRFPVLAPPVDRHPDAATLSAGGMEPSGWQDWVKTIGGGILGML